MPYDQLFKEVLHELFELFLRLFYPDVAARLDFSTVTFLDTEGFTEFPAGERRDADVIAQVTTLDGQPEIVHFYIEIEAQRRSTFGERMFDYYGIFRRRRLRVFPIVIYLSAGAGGLTQETYREITFGRQIVLFQYEVIGLRDLNADDYIESENALGSALSSFMRVGKLGRLAQKLLALQRVARSEVNDAQKFALSTLIEVGMPLKGEDAAEFARLLEQNQTREAGQMLNVFEESGIKKGIAQGIAIGEERARSVQQRSILKILRRKFGELPETVTAYVESVTAAEELDALLDRALDGESLAGFRANHAPE